MPRQGPQGPICHCWARLSSQASQWTTKATANSTSFPTQRSLARADIPSASQCKLPVDLALFPGQRRPRTPKLKSALEAYFPPGPGRQSFPSVSHSKNCKDHRKETLRHCCLHLPPTHAHPAVFRALSLPDSSLSPRNGDPKSIFQLFLQRHKMPQRLPLGRFSSHCPHQLACRLRPRARL